MAIIYNHYWDDKDPAKPFTKRVVCNAFTIVPNVATRIAPPKYAYGTIPCWDGSKWVVRADWRKETVYDITTGKKAQYPTVDVDEVYFDAHFTLLKPNSEYDIWDGEKWVLDKDAEKAAKVRLLGKKRRLALDTASREIEMITEALACLKESDDDTVDYENALRDWKKYRGRLLVLKIVTGKERLPVSPESVNV